MTFDYSQHRVLVTGATSGIGKATAIAFANAGADVFLTGRDAQRGRAVVQQIAPLSGRGDFLAGDITRSDFCDRLVDQSVSHLGGLDIVVNSAGIIYHATAEDTSDQQWLDTFAVNVHGMFYVCRAALPHLKTNGGSIINIASDAGTGGSYHLTAYCASKGAVIQMCRAMAKDYAPYNIRVVPICPGDVDTEMLRGEFKDRGLTAEQGLRESADAVPLKRVATAEEIAKVILFTCSNAATFMTGHAVIIDGGNRA